MKSSKVSKLILISDGCLPLVVLGPVSRKTRQTIGPGNSPGKSLFPFSGVA